MLDQLDRLSLPPGVRAVRGALVDEVRGVRYPTNATADALLERVGEPLEATAARIAARWRLVPTDARRDVLRFAWQLNGFALANVRPGRSGPRRLCLWIALALRLLPIARFPEPVVSRRALDTSTCVRAVVTSVSAVGGRAAAIACATAFALILVGLLAGGAPVGVALAVGAATGGALLLHELGHVLALQGVPAAVLLVGARTSVLHPPLDGRRARAVSLAGPSLTAILGLTLATLGLLIDAPAAALAACPPAGHALAATVAGGDGRAACGVGPRSAVPVRSGR